MYEQISFWRLREGRGHWLTTAKSEHGILRLILVSIIINITIIVIIIIIIISQDK